MPTHTSVTRFIAKTYFGVSKQQACFAATLALQTNPQPTLGNCFSAVQAALGQCAYRYFGPCKCRSCGYATCKQQNLPFDYNAPWQHWQLT